MLQLVHCPKDDKVHRSAEDGTYDKEEWAQFLHTKNRIYTDPNDIRREIEAETDRMAGENKGICPEPISLKYYSEKVLNLTMVDLPGKTNSFIGILAK